MPIYIMFSKLTDEGRRTIKKNPERIKEVDKEIEMMGAKVLAQYAVMGEYDFINILEAPNNETIARVSIELGARGTVQLTTMPAIPIFEFIEKMEVQYNLSVESKHHPIPVEYEEKMY
ncbi:MAG: GYD domain-containing protein [Syntrophorhabdaceae bacterium]|nr:GYD domain-containing protein [Syntrophorhabdaceae bacterium]